MRYMKKVNKEAVVKELRGFVKISSNDVDELFEHLRLMFTIGSQKSIKGLWLNTLDKYSVEA